MGDFVDGGRTTPSDKGDIERVGMPFNVSAMVRPGEDRLSAQMKEFWRSAREHTGRQLGFLGDYGRNMSSCGGLVIVNADKK